MHKYIYIYIFINRHRKRKVMLGPAGRARPAGNEGRNWSRLFVRKRVELLTELSRR